VATFALNLDLPLVKSLPLISKKAGGLSIGHLNIRSLPGKLDHFKLIMQNTTKALDILTLSKTWLCDNIDDSEIDLPGYSIIRRDRKGKTSGGVDIPLLDGIGKARLVGVWIVHY
jgi:hypothetical protein